MSIKANNRRRRVGLREQQRRCAVTTSDVGNGDPGAQLLKDSFQGGYPIAAEIGFVAGSEEPLGSAKKTIVMLSPWNAGSRTKALSDHRFVMINSRNRVETARHGDRAIRIGKDRSLFGRQGKCRPYYVVSDIAGSSLRAQPFTELALVQAGLRSELLRGRRSTIS